MGDLRVLWNKVVEANTVEERFYACVEVIRGLPATGPVKPSNDDKLLFYSLYKQATAGPCAGARPSFWDVINRAKYDAWLALGDLSRDAAMHRYIATITHMAKGLPASAGIDPAALVLPPLRPQQSAHGLSAQQPSATPSSSSSSSPPPPPSASTAAAAPPPSSPARPAAASSAPSTPQGRINNTASATAPRTAPPIQRSAPITSAQFNDTRSEVSDVFFDPENAEEDDGTISTEPTAHHSGLSAHALAAATATAPEGAGGGTGAGRVGDVSEELREVVAQLQTDLTSALERIQSAEQQLEQIENQVQTREGDSNGLPWPLNTLPTATGALLLVWPLIVTLVAMAIAHRRRANHRH